MVCDRDESVKTFSFDKVYGTMKLTRTVEIPLINVIQVHGIMKVKDHDKIVDLIVDAKTMNVTFL